MKQGLVSIMMPVFNGELFLPLALDCLLAQDYANFEIIILDNQSTDGTRVICQQYASRDSRIRYVPDDRYRITHDAANHLATLATGEFAMLACDDDLWVPTFLSACVGFLRTHPDVGVVFPNAAYVDINGIRGESRLLAGRDIYNERHDKFGNFKRFLRHRRIVPPIFGVYRSDVMRAALPFDTFDETIADVDNLFFLKIITMTKVHCLDEVLFYYRNKFRGLEPTLQNGIRANPNWFVVWIYFARHQRKFTARILQVIDSAPFAGPQKVALRLYTFSALVYFTSFAHLRAAVGRLLTRWGWREGVAVKKDQHHDLRVEALKQTNYREQNANRRGRP
ncbi:MAG: glycosyltransferase family 2 protein [Betaproteobacteria bacterium]|nr:MAG: glycosyltransferase family 2 protein [Betaproteobacteria bacterium]